MSENEQEQVVNEVEDSEEEVYFEKSDLYEGEPEDVVRSVNNKQDDDLVEGARGLILASQRNTADTIAWYNRAHTSPPFDPDGMCLKICRSARNIGSRYPSAISAQHATPTNKRVQRVRDLRRGMVIYFDDVNDSNPYGHVVTMVGRVKDVPTHYLSSLVVETNSVVRNRIVRVRGNYFQRHWGDEYQFGATWLNGQDLKLPRPPAPKLGDTFAHAVRDVQRSLNFHKAAGHTRIANALARDLAELRETIRTING